MESKTLFLPHGAHRQVQDGTQMNEKLPIAIPGFVGTRVTPSHLTGKLPTSGGKEAASWRK